MKKKIKVGRKAQREREDMTQAIIRTRHKTWVASGCCKDRMKGKLSNRVASSLGEIIAAGHGYDMIS